jgi:DNA-directed RNA polymerase sigma subunit (sigma70/sigma32)
MKISDQELKERKSIHDAIATLEEKNEPPTPYRISVITEIKVEKVKMLLANKLSMVDMDAPVGSSGESSSSFGEFLADTDTLNPGDELDAREIKSSVEKFLSKLTPEESIALRYQLDYDGQDGTLLKEDIASKMALSKERVRQITNSAYRKLLRPDNVKLIICEK